MSAVKGSIAPRTEVMVDPIRFIACIRARLDNIVGIKAKSNSDNPVFTLGMGCIVENKEIPIKTINPPIRKM